MERIPPNGQVTAQRGLFLSVEIRIFSYTVAFEITLYDEITFAEQEHAKTEAAVHIFL